jgi:glycosyltransferase involved in cell wall biosynthesis
MARKLRVAYVDQAGDIGGGAEEALLDILRYLDRDRIEPVLLHAERAEWLRDVEMAQLRTRAVFPETDPVFEHSREALSSLAERLAGLWQSIGPVRKLRIALSAEDVDIVHTNSLKCHILGGLAARWLRKPLVWDVRDILEPGSARSLLIEVARVTRPHIVAMSSAVAESLAEAGCDTTVVLGARPMDKYVPLPPDQKLREAIGLKTGDKVLSVVARLTPWKGHQTLLDAFRRVLDDEPDARLLVIGDAGFWTDDYTADLHRQAEDLGCAEAVYWLGFREDIPQLLALTDVMVLPSKDEPFGIVLVEAMAAGKPVIATRTGGPLDIVTEGVTGLLVEAGDVGQLADAILQLLGDPERAAAMGRAGRKRAEDHFDISRVLTQLYDVYDKMLKQR